MKTTAEDVAAAKGEEVSKTVAPHYIPIIGRSSRLVSGVVSYSGQRGNQWEIKGSQPAAVGLGCARADITHPETMLYGRRGYLSNLVFFALLPGKEKSSSVHDLPARTMYLRKPSQNV